MWRVSHVIGEIFPTLRYVETLTLSAPSMSIKTTFVDTSSTEGILIIPEIIIDQTSEDDGAELCVVGWRSLRNTEGIKDITVLIPPDTSEEWSRLADYEDKNNIKTGYQDGPWWVPEGESNLSRNILNWKINRLVRTIYEKDPDIFKGRSIATMRIYKPKEGVAPRYRYLAAAYGFTKPNSNDC